MAHSSPIVVGEVTRYFERRSVNKKVQLWQHASGALEHGEDSAPLIVAPSEGSSLRTSAGSLAEDPAAEPGNAGSLRSSGDPAEVQTSARSLAEDLAAPNLRRVSRRGPCGRARKRRVPSFLRRPGGSSRRILNERSPGQVRGSVIGLTGRSRITSRWTLTRPISRRSRSSR